jgi:hypothetical protein
MSPPPGALTYGSGPVPVNPDKFAVDSKKYPTYKANGTIKPPATQYCWPEGCAPIEMTNILPTDVWVVTHVFKGLYMIESDEYQNRQCRFKLVSAGMGAKQNVDGGGMTSFSKTCTSAHLFAIYVDTTGKISGGWELLPGPNILFAERDTYLSPTPGKASQWPVDFSFRAQPEIDRNENTQ